MVLKGCENNLRDLPLSPFSLCCGISVFSFRGLLYGEPHDNLRHMRSMTKVKGSGLLSPEEAITDQCRSAGIAPVLSLSLFKKIHWHVSPTISPFPVPAFSPRPVCSMRHTPGSGSRLDCGAATGTLAFGCDPGTIFFLPDARPAPVARQQA